MLTSYFTVLFRRGWAVPCLFVLALAGAAPAYAADAAASAALRSQIQAINEELERAAETSMAPLLARRATLLGELTHVKGADLTGLGLSLGFRATLERAGSELLESAFEATGRIELDAIERVSSSGVVYYLSGDFGRLQLDLGMDKPLAGQQVSVSGLRIGNTVYVARWAAAVSKRPALALPQRGSIGEQRIAVLMIEFPNMPLHATLTREALTASYFGATGSVDHFLRVSSAGKTWATGKVFGPFRLDRSYVGEFLDVTDAALRAAASSVDFTQFDHVVFVTPVTHSSDFESIRGLSTIGTRTTTLPNQQKFVSTFAWLGDLYLLDPAERVAVAAHELGHGLGLGHANALTFGSDPVGPLGMMGISSVYKDVFSVMGSSTAARPLAAPHLSRLGWIAEGGALKTVETNGSFTLRPYVSTTQPGIAALRVRRGSGADAPYLWIEYRQAVPGTIEDELPYYHVNILPPAPRVGALVHYERSQGELDTQLLRFNFSSEDRFKLAFTDAPIAAGQTWVDPYSNLTVVVGMPGADGLPVTVQYRETGNTQLLPQAADVGAEGGTVALRVDAAAGGTWSATTSAAWLRVVGAADGRGSRTLEVVADANPASTARWAAVAVNNVVSVVTQQGAKGALSLAQENASYAATGGAGSIAIAASSEQHEWSLEVSDNWIRNVKFSRTNFIGSGTLSYEVSQNTGPARSGSIKVGEQVFTITQMAGTSGAYEYAAVSVPMREAPSSRASMAMVQIAGGKAIMYGGTDRMHDFTSSRTDTWMWDGQNWEQVFPAHNPGARGGVAMAYDPGRNQLILFGGLNDRGDPTSNATWTWNGSDWVELKPPVSPGARAYHSMAYNPISKRIMLFGGYGDRSQENWLYNDTWEWDGANWVRLQPAAAPPGRQFAAMAFDEARKEMVLFGGSIEANTRGVFSYLDDTWVWDGRTWARRAAASPGPSGRRMAHMAFDPQLGKLVMVGGTNSYAAEAATPGTIYLKYLEEMWTWDGTQWVQLFPPKEVEFSYSYGMFYDAARRGLFVYLGDDVHCRNPGAQAYILRAGYSTADN